MSKIHPGDWVEITSGTDKITIKIAKKNKPKGVVRVAAGILKDCPELVEEMLRIREEEDDRFHELTTEQKVKIRGILDLGEMVDVDSELALKAAELRALSKKNYQRKLRLPDAIVAATAFVYSAVLITRNIDDFKHLQDHGLRLWNPFERSE